MKTKMFTVFTLKLARQLINKGFKCVSVQPDRNKPWLNVFKFEDTPELQKAIAEMQK